MNEMFYKSQNYSTQYSDSRKHEVIEKLTYGFAIAVLMATIVIYGGMNPLFGLLAFVGEIVAIIGYFFARQEGTIEKLYYLFVVSSSVLLGFTLQTVLAVVPNAMAIITESLGITALLVGGIYYYTDTERPEPGRMVRYLLPLSLGFIVVAIIGIFVSFGSFGMLLFSIFGALLFSFYLIYDLSRLLKGQYMSPSRMAWNIYWDILLIFKMILQILLNMNRK